jgi:hypothetical protein
LLLTGGLVYYILRRVGIAPLLDAFGHLHLPTFVVAEGVLAAALVVASVRWAVLLAGQGWRHSIGRLLRLNFIASFYNVVLPGQESGNAVKAFMLAQSSGHASAIWASVLVDQLTLFIGLLLTGLGGLVAYTGMPGRGSWLAVVAILLAATSGITAFTIAGVLHEPVRRASVRLRWGKHRREWLYPFWSAIGSYRLAVGHILLALALAIVYQLLVDASIFTLARGLAIPVSYPDFIRVLCAVYIAQSVPFTIAGLGVREATLVFFLLPLGVPAADAVALSFTVVILYYAFAMPGAVLQFAGDIPRPER